MVNEALGEAFVAIRAALTPLKEGLDEARTLTLDQVEKIGKASTKAGKSFSIGFTAPIMAAGGALAVLGSQNDAAMRQIAVSTGAVGDELSSLGNSYRSVLGQVPDASDRVVSALTQIQGATGATGGVLEDLTKKTLDLARINDEELNPLIQSSTRAFAAWEIGAEDQSAALDRLFRISQATNVPVGALTSSMDKQGATLRALGLGFDETAMMLGAWEREGVNTKKMISGLSVAANKLAKDGSSLQEGLAFAIDTVKEFGPESKEAIAATEMFGGAALDLRDAIGRDAFGMQNLDQVLATSADAITRTSDDTKSLQESAAELWRTIQIELMPIGQQLINMLKEMMPALQSVARTVGAAIGSFGQLPEPIQRTVFLLAGLLAALGPAMILFGKVATGFAAIAKSGALILPVLKGAGAAFTLLTGPVGLAVAAVAALVAIWVTWGDEIKAFLSRVLEPFQVAFEVFVGRIRDAAQPFLALATAVGRFFMAFAEMAILPIFEGALAAIGLVLGVVWEGLKLAWEAFSAVAEIIGIVLMPILAPLAEALKFLGGLMIDVVVIGLRAMYDGLVASVEAWTWLLEKATEVMRGVTTAFRATRDAAVEAVRSMVEGIREWLGGRLTAVVDTVKGHVESVTGFFRTMKERVVGNSYVPDMIDMIGQEFARLQTLMVRPAQEATSLVEAAFQSLNLQAKQMLNWVPLMPTVASNMESIGEETEHADGVFKRFLGSIKEGITGGGGLKALLGPVMQGVMANFTGAWGHAFQAATAVGRAFAGDFSGVTQLVAQHFTKLVSLVGTGMEKVNGFLKTLFGGPNANELAGRKVVEKFESNIHEMLSDMQAVEAGNESWKKTVIVVRDAYMAMGRSEQEALAAVERLWKSSKGGAEEVEKAMKPIQEALDFVATRSDETGRSFDELRADGVEAARLIRQDIDRAEQELMALGFTAEQVAAMIERSLGGLDIRIPVGFDVAGGGVDIGGTSVPIQPFATGGIVMRPTLGMLAEKGQPEAVIPLDRLEGLLESRSGGGGGSGSPLTIQNVFDVSGVLDGAGLVQLIHREIIPILTRAITDNVGATRTNLRDGLGVTT